MYIYEHQEWPEFRWDEHRLSGILFEVTFLLGTVIGKMNAVESIFKKEVLLTDMTDEIVKSSAIEGELLNFEEVRSSVARKFDMPESVQTASSHYIEGIVEMMTDARCNFKEKLTFERLCSWQASLFPTGYSGMNRIRTGEIRDDAQGPMQVVSSKFGNNYVYYEAPPAEKLPEYINDFLEWLDTDNNVNPLIKAAIAHLWFITLHPFDDGNGRIARAITELMLSRADKSSYRFYSMSGQILKARNDYYRILEQTQKGSLEVTMWIQWFLETLLNSLKESSGLVDKIVTKAMTWQKLNKIALDNNQKKIITMMLDGFEGNLTSSKWAKICKCSQDTAIRSINYLVENKVLALTIFWPVWKELTEIFPENNECKPTTYRLKEHVSSGSQTVYRRVSKYLRRFLALIYAKYAEIIQFNLRIISYISFRYRCIRHRYNNLFTKQPNIPEKFSLKIPAHRLPASL